MRVLDCNYKRSIIFGRLKLQHIIRPASLLAYFFRRTLSSLIYVKLDSWHTSTILNKFEFNLNRLTSVGFLDNINSQLSEN